MKLLKSLTWMVMILLAVGFIGCSDDDDDNPVGTPDTDTFEEIFAAGDAYYSNGTKNITAETVYTKMWVDQTEEYFLIDWRSTDDYNTAHIDGAVDWSITQLMAKHAAGDIPTDMPIVNICYSGQTASQATAAMRMLGYDAYNLKFGMCGWTTADDVPMGGWQTLAAGGQTLETSANTFTDVVGLPERTEDLEYYLAEYLNAGTANMKAVDIYTLLNDGDDLNDPILLNFWSGDMYSVGHIPGAYQAKPITMDLLEKIPADKKIVIYCHTGQTSSQLTPWFRAMGYEAYSMLYGMNSVNQDAWGDDLVTYHAPSMDYPVVYGN